MTQPMPDYWVKYNHLTDTYDTKDGTSVAAELVDSYECIADVIRVAHIRYVQRIEKKHDRPRTT
jgi:hypothetical protein